MLQPFDSELGDFVEEICADLCRFECAATAGCESAQVSVEREVALGNDAFADIRVEAPKRPRPTRPAADGGRSGRGARGQRRAGPARGFAQSRLVLDLASGKVERVTLTLRRGAGLPMQAP